MDRHVRYQRDCDAAWTQRILEHPGCERLLSCVQCGTCSGSCPLSLFMDVPPRRVMALVREGFRRDALACRTIWLCASCYSCAVHCPQQIAITDVMFALKQEAMRERLFPRRFPIPVLEQEFLRMVRARGRISEFWVVFRLILRTSPLAVFSMARAALALLRTGRLSFRRTSIEQIEQLRRALGDREEGA